jgi:hypothetical protein
MPQEDDMAINKISDILSRPASQDTVKEATSGKKEKTTASEQSEVKKTTLEDKVIFSDDAKKLQETEVILQTALQKLREMDEVNQKNLEGITRRINSNFYDKDTVVNGLVDEIFPEEQLRDAVEKRIRAEKYVSELNRLEEELSEERLAEIRQRIESGYYNSPEVIDAIAETLVSVVDI